MCRPHNRYQINYIWIDNPMRDMNNHHFLASYHHTTTSSSNDRSDTPVFSLSGGSRAPSMQDDLDHVNVASEPTQNNSNRNSVSPATSTIYASDDDNNTNNSLHQETLVGENTVRAEPGETHAFLFNDRSETRTAGQFIGKDKHNSTSVFITWWFGLASLVAAIAALITIVITMAKYNDKEQPEWRYSINLNTVIAVLATILRSCMVVVAEEVISQLKWLLFRRPRPLWHLEHFDSAARGPWGSLLLFFRTRSLNAAFVGCIVIVLSIGIGPFSQQAVKSVSCERPLAGAEASIRVSQWMYSSKKSQGIEGTWLLDLDLDTKVAILDGLVNSNTTRSDITPSCTTGNCVFPSRNRVTHSSVGLCKKCVDTSNRLMEVELEDQDQRIRLSDGNGIGGTPNGTLPRIVLSTLARSSVQRDWGSTSPNEKLLNTFDNSLDDILAASILNVSIITFTNNGCERLGQEGGSKSQRCPGADANWTLPIMNFLNAVAATCSFYPCIRDYAGTVRDTIFTETVINETPIKPARSSMENRIYDFKDLHDPCIIDDQTYTRDNISSVPIQGNNFTTYNLYSTNTTFPTACIYGTDGIYAMSLGTFMKSLMNGNCTTIPELDAEFYKNDYKTLKCDPWQLETLVNNGLASFDAIDRNMQSVATAVTSEMRRKGSYYDPQSYSAPPTFATGTVLRTTSCTKFDWVWLSFPLALIILTILLLCITCGKMLFDKSRIPVWKSSILPLLLAGHRLRDVAAAKHMDDMKANTEPLVVSLVQDERGWGFAIEDFKDKKKKRED